TPLRTTRHDALASFSCSSSGNGSGVSLDELPKPGERKVDPIGPIVELVAQLVDALLDEKEVEEGTRRHRVGRKDPRPTDGIEPPAKKGRRHGTMPRGHPRTKRDARLRPRPRAKRRERHVVIGAQHAGDVDERRTLRLSLLERACRLTLEV